MSAFLQNLPVKVLGGKFICLRPPPLLWPHTPPPLHTVYVLCTLQYTYSHRERGGGGELTMEKVTGAMLHKAARKYQHGYISSLQTILNNSKDAI